MLKFTDSLGKILIVTMLTNQMHILRYNYNPKHAGAYEY
jgi:hypothetical protein